MSAERACKLVAHGGSPPNRDDYPPTPEAWKKAREDSKRSSVIVGDALLKDILGMLIREVLSPKDEVLDRLLRERQMGLSDKARLAYVLGLIEKGTMADLQHIHNIRNKWAHIAKPSLSDAQVQKNIFALSTVGSKKKREVTEENYMDFCDEAMVRCVGVIGLALSRVWSKKKRQKHRKAIEGKRTKGRGKAD
jgi:DNA-binding MltR family transcriptional regulator